MSSQEEKNKELEEEREQENIYFENEVQDKILTELIKIRKLLELKQ